jgi:hypothetical protein
LFCQNYMDAKLVCQTVGVALKDDWLVTTRTDRIVTPILEDLSASYHFFEINKLSFLTLYAYKKTVLWSASFGMHGQSSSVNSQFLVEAEWWDLSIFD